MRARGNSRHARTRLCRLALAASLGGIGFGSAVVTAAAQEALSTFATGAGAGIAEDAQLFLEADTVVYDRDSAVVTAAGGVRIDYGGYRLVSREVIYNQNTRRLFAKGDVEIRQPDGNIVYADTADITENFAEGFVTALRIETIENTRFAAAGAERSNGSVTRFEQGVYTACQACAENPERAPLWQVKARKIVWDQNKKVIYYYGAKFELFGTPIAYLPYFQSADPTVKRKSGFLVPSIVSSENLGYGLRVPYFFALSDSYDATVAGTYYSKQGFLGEVEYRQATNNGFFTLQAAGISQQDPDAFFEEGPFAFDPLTGTLKNVSPDFTDDRGMIGTTGNFALSDRWSFGWDILAQSDQNFSNTYNIENFNEVFHTSEVYLTGLGDQSFFDLRGQRFDIQSRDEFEQDVQPDVLPSLDYERIEDDIYGGQVEVDVNVVNLRREEADTRAGNFLLCEPNFIVNGGCDGRAAFEAGRLSGFPFRYDFFDRKALEGDYTRGTIDAEWQRTITTDGGLLLTPSLALRGDLYRADMSTGGFPFAPADPFRFVNFDGGSPDFNPFISIGGIDVDSSGFRGMATAGLEARYPYQIRTENASHIIEPIAQLLVRPDEMEAGLLPNEDAQSLVFNTANLFEHDKFSGYDRIEGGTRANVGLRYAGTFAMGYALDAAVGQSYSVGGQNSYAESDLALVGFDSGLETDQSDYVTSLALGTPVGLELGVQARFDEETYETRRTDLAASYGNSRGSVGVTYSYIGEQPIYGFPLDRSQVSTNASLKLSENWTAFGALGYDIENSSLINRSLGLQYLDECFTFVASYQRTEDNYQVSEAQNTLLFRVGLRTIADFDYTYDLEGDDDDD